MNQGYRAIAMLPNEWKLPFNLAIGVHLLVLLGALYLPGIFKATPKFADIYTVSIINIAEPAPSTPEPQQAQAKTPPPVVKKPLKTKKIAPIEEPQEAPQPAPVKSVSLKPLKKKKVKKVKKVKEPPKTSSRQKDLERKRRERLAKALREEELLAEQARLAKEALEAERRLLKSQKAIPAARATARPASRSGSAASSARASGTSKLIENQYLASILNRLHQYWTLPEYLLNDPSLNAVVVLTINKNGTIANRFFESKASNRVFNQFVTKTLEAAAPLPPIPPAMKKQRFEVGLVFKPGSIQ